MIALLKVFQLPHQLNITEGKRKYRHPDFKEFILDWVQNKVRME